LYTESIGSRKTLGDVDVLYHDGLYHLFHLVLPNHDFIAHAVSEDGFSWYRVANALFLGHPGCWDDSMLWTMHVSPDPHRPGSWRMFYTGLSRGDRGLKQRIGMAVSDDLYRWTKVSVSWRDHRRAPSGLSADHQGCQAKYDAGSSFPLQPEPPHYEHSLDSPRKWVSWRDPFYYHEGDRGWLLCAGRIDEGPFVRRGCVALMEETAPNHFEQRPPLFHPGLYDDIEVPNLFRLEGEYYLVGSLREDAKVRYWHTDHLGAPGEPAGPWRSYYDNVLLARGNYAGRICEDPHGVLIWNFFTPDINIRTTYNIMPPPKRLLRSSGGLLRAKSFEGFSRRVARAERPDRLHSLQCSVSSSPHACELKPSEGHFQVGSESGFEAYVFPEEVQDFRMRAKLSLRGLGKCGLVFRIDHESRDGYYVSLDLTKGVAQIRAWGTGSQKLGEEMMQFHSLQAAYWQLEQRGVAHIECLAFGSYLELSVEDRVILSLADQTYQRGGLGFYVESATMIVSDVTVEHLRRPSQSDEHLSAGEDSPVDGDLAKP